MLFISDDCRLDVGQVIKNSLSGNHPYLQRVYRKAWKANFVTVFVKQDVLTCIINDVLQFLLQILNCSKNHKTSF